MKRKSITQVKAISGNTPEETAFLFNQTMNELADLNPTYERDGNMFWIFFSTESVEPEDLVEAHELQGEHHTCIDCHRCIRDLNRFGQPLGNSKHATCSKDGTRVRLDSTVCETFYEERGKSIGKESES